MNVKVISLPYVFQVLYVLCFIRLRYQVSVYRTIGPLVFKIFDRFDNPASVSNTPARQMTYNYLLPINFWLLLFPADLCCDWTMGTIPVIQSIVDYRNLVTLGFYVVLGKVVYFALCKQGRLNRALIMVIIQYKLLRIYCYFMATDLC